MDIMLLDINEGVTKTGSPYLYGKVALPEGVQLPFKSWGISLDSFPYKSADCLEVDGVISQYAGSDQLVIEEVKGGSLLPTSAFYKRNPKKQDWSEYFDGVVNTLPTPHRTLMKIIYANPNVKSFRDEWAAATHHDAIDGGLMWHSFKVAYYMDRLFKLNPGLSEKVDRDMMIMGALLHDLGKVWEYKNGIPVVEGLAISHRVLLIEWLTDNYRLDFITLFGGGEEGERKWYRLLGMISQHHGEFEERPRTIEGMMLHLCDNFEAQTTALVEGIMSGNYPIKLSGFILN